MRQAESPQAGLERGDDRVADGCCVRQPDLGADRDVAQLQRLDGAAKIGFGLAVAILRGGVEVVDAGVDRACDRPLLVRGPTAHHQAADGAAAEPEYRQLQPRASESARLHGVVSAKNKTAAELTQRRPRKEGGCDVGGRGSGLPTSG